MEPAKITCVDLFITNECNLNCSYCFHSQKQGVMSVETGKSILDYIRTNPLTGSSVVFNFFGGEPLLYPDTIKSIISYGKETWKDKKIDFFVSTNATYFDEDFFKFLRANKVSVQVSIDGKPEVQKAQRGRSEDILDNAKKIFAIVPETNTRMTYTPETVSQLVENVEYIYSLGCKNIMHHNVVEADWKEEHLTEYIKQFWGLINLREKYLDLRIHFIEQPLDIMLGKVAPHPASCNAGNGMLAFDIDGTIYPCHRFCSNQEYRLGNLPRDDLQRGIFTNISKETIRKCQTCIARDICHTCIYCHKLKNESFFEPIEMQCKIIQAEYIILRQVADRIALMNVNSTIARIAQLTMDMAHQFNKMVDALERIEQKLGEIKC